MTFPSSNYYFVVATQYSEKDFWEKSQIAFFLDKSGYKHNSYIVYENKEGLSKTYNNFITEKNHNKRLIFVHDDVIIEDLFWQEKLTLAFEKYDIVGLAGSKKCDLSSSIFAWHLMCPKEELVGEVSHAHQKKIWTTVFGPTESRALILDGLFLAVDVKKLLETNTRFDENFNFHHYDITFCLNANKNKLKMGVYPIRVVHFGLGDSMNSQEWQESAKKFKSLYT
jgi:hypothetical protein